MKILIEKGFSATSLQGTGQFKSRGIGALDTFSLRLANLLVQNPMDEEGLEILDSELELLIPAGVVLAVTGAAREIHLNDYELPSYRPVYVRKKSHLSFAPAKRGMVTYLAVSGGFSWSDEREDLRQTLMVRSISPQQAAFVGRMERKAEGFDLFVTVPWSIDGQIVFKEGPIRVIETDIYDDFPAFCRERFLKNTYLLSNDSDREKILLEGPRITDCIDVSKRFFPLVWGSIYLTPGGDPVIAMPDCRSSGSYPVFAQVTLVDLPRVAQCRPGSSLRFEAVSLTQAEVMYAQQESYLKKMQERIGKALRK
jgi:antagonist of KipI